jgi:hypothetical protein
MRTTFASLDDVLIERLFQPMSDLVSHRAGFGRMTAACFCVDIASLAWIVSQARALSDAVVTWEAGSAFIDLSLLLLGLAALTSLRTLFRRAAPKQANPLRLAMRPHRAIVLLMLVTRLVQLHAPDVAEAAEIAMLLCAAAALYLGACAERPPVRRVSTSYLAAPGRA